MAGDSRISELATQIKTDTSTVNDYLTATGRSQPSFDIDGPTNLALDSVEPEKARLRCIEASIELQDLLQGPIACLRPSINATSLEAIYRYNIPRHVPLDGKEISFQDLADKCDMYEPDLRRILRYAILYHRVFQEPRAGIVRHSTASQLLVKDPAIFDTVGMMFDESWQAFARTCDAMMMYKSQEPHLTGYSLAHQPCTTPWSRYAAHPALQKRFASAMTSLTSNPGQSPDYLVDGYPWTSLPCGSTVIDMGGSNGHVSVAIAKAHQHLKLVVQDLPEVVASAQQSWEEEDHLAKEVKDRVRFVAQDFLEEQMVPGEVFLLRWICHDWPDAFVIRILRNLRGVLKEGNVVVINDQIMPGWREINTVIERQIRTFDMCMLSFFNSREREKADWETLFREADERFTDIRIWTPDGSSFAIIEATWRAQ